MPKPSTSNSASGYCTIRCARSQQRTQKGKGGTSRTAHPPPLAEWQKMQDLTKRYDVDHLPWFLTEWGATWGGGRTVEAFPVNHRNTLRAATFTLKLIKEMRRYPLAITHNVDGLACRDGDTVRMLFWHHDPDSLETAHPSRTEILFEHLPFHRARLRIEEFTREHNTFSAWQRGGSSRSPSPAERQRLDAARDPLLLPKIVEIHRGAWSAGEMQMFPGECLRLQRQGRF